VYFDELVAPGVSVPFETELCNSLHNYGASDLDPRHDDSVVVDYRPREERRITGIAQLHHMTGHGVSTMSP
jgi:hypothetical protein